MSSATAARSMARWQDGGVVGRMLTAAAETGLVYAIKLRTRFRGIDTREGLIWRGSVGWAEWSPFLDYPPAQCVPWLRAAIEAAEEGWPAPVRARVPLNCTIPAVGPEHAYGLAASSGCRTAKVKVGEPGQSLADDLARVEAVRDALGSDGRVRVDANGAWDVETAGAALGELARFDLEYAEQPCTSVEELAQLRLRLARAGVDVPVAADESIRRSEDPYRVVELGAADIAVLKVQPLGGVRACLQIAERIGLPVVVSSALETSVGIRAGLALAAALPELPYACGLNTVALLTDDVAEPPLLAAGGELAVSDLVVDPVRLSDAKAPASVTESWRARLAQTAGLLAEVAHA